MTEDRVLLDRRDLLHVGSVGMLATGIASSITGALAAENNSGRLKECLRGPFHTLQEWDDAAATLLKKKGDMWFKSLDHDSYRQREDALFLLLSLISMADPLPPLLQKEFATHLTFEPSLEKRSRVKVLSDQFHTLQILGPCRLPTLHTSWHGMLEQIIGGGGFSVDPDCFKTFPQFPWAHPQQFPSLTNTQILLKLCKALEAIPVFEAYNRVRLVPRKANQTLISGEQTLCVIDGDKIIFYGGPKTPVIDINHQSVHPTNLPKMCVGIPGHFVHLSHTPPQVEQQHATSGNWIRTNITVCHTPQSHSIVIPTQSLPQTVTTINEHILTCERDPQQPGVMMCTIDSFGVAPKNHTLRKSQWISLSTAAGKPMPYTREGAPGGLNLLMRVPGCPDSGLLTLTIFTRFADITDTLQC